MRSSLSHTAYLRQGVIYFSITENRDGTLEPNRGSQRQAGTSLRSSCSGKTCQTDSLVPPDRRELRELYRFPRSPAADSWKIVIRPQQNFAWERARDFDPRCNLQGNRLKFFP